MKDVVGYEGKYAIDEEGNVFNARTHKKIKHTNRPNGYKAVSLSDKGKRRFHYVHRLLAQAYLSNFSEELQVDHIDRDRSNNKLSNLRMVTNQENDFNRTAKGYRWHKGASKWVAYIRKDGKQHYLGLHTCPVMARVSYLFAKKELHVISSHSTYDPVDRSLAHKNGE